MALGGDADKSGFVSKEKLINIIKEEFALTIDMVVSIDLASKKLSKILTV